MADDKPLCGCSTHCHRHTWQRCKDLPPLPTLAEALARCAANPDGPQPTALFALSEAIGRYMARLVLANLQRYPDIVDENDPRLLAPLPAPETAPIPQWVYFLSDAESGLIKIGTSVDVNRRIAAVAWKTKSKPDLIGAISGGYATETAFHKTLAAHRVHGEWFRKGPWVDVVAAGLSGGEGAEAIIGRLAALESRDG